MSFYKAIIRPVLFQLNPEAAHHLTVEACRVAGVIPGIPSLSKAVLSRHDPMLQTEVAGLQLDNPIGLAAGWDKSGRAIRMLGGLGFGFTEIGSISARSSRGNPKPRLFRIPQEQAILVNYGLPNDGAEIVRNRLAKRPPGQCLGVNIVKTNDGPQAPECTAEEILADYERSVSLLQHQASYLMLNLSCPNAHAGKNFFDQPGNISELLQRLEPLGIVCPIFLKIPPLDDPLSHELILAECEAFDFVRGFCFNLPSGKPDSLHFKGDVNSYGNLPGAVAGRPVASLINRCISGMYSQMDPSRYAIIGAGGVFTAEDAYEKIRLGASLVQLYTAMIYEGPGIVGRICCGLSELLRRDGFQHISESVGTAHRSN